MEQLQLNSNHIITSTQENDLFGRTGVIKIKRSAMFFMPPNQNALKALFENFYPYAIHPDHTFGIDSGMIYYGYSPHFKKMTEGEKLPIYEAYFRTDEDGSINFVRMQEVL